MAESQASPAGSEARQYVPPQTCKAFETAQGVMCLRLGKDILTWGLNKDIGSQGKNTKAWSFEGMCTIAKQLLLDILANQQILFIDLEGKEESLDADYFRPDDQNVHVNDEKRMTQGFYRLVHYLNLIAAPDAAFEPFVGMTHRKLKDDLGYNACRGTLRVTNALYKREYQDPSTGTMIILCVLTGRVIRGYLVEAREEQGKTGVGVLPPTDAAEEAAEDGEDKKILPTAMKQAMGQPPDVVAAARRVGELLYELHESRETALWVDVLKCPTGAKGAKNLTAKDIADAMVRFQALHGSLVRKRGPSAAGGGRRRASLDGEDASLAALSDMAPSSSEDDGASRASSSAAAASGGARTEEKKMKKMNKPRKGENWRGGPGEASSKQMFGGGATGKQTDFVSSPPRRKDKFARIQEAQQARHDAMAAVIATSAMENSSRLDLLPKIAGLKAQGFSKTLVLATMDAKYHNVVRMLYDGDKEEEAEEDGARSDAGEEEDEAKDRGGALSVSSSSGDEDFSSAEEEEEEEGQQQEHQQQPKGGRNDAELEAIIGGATGGAVESDGSKDTTEAGASSSSSSSSEDEPTAGAVAAPAPAKGAVAGKVCRGRDAGGGGAKSPNPAAAKKPKPQSSAAANAMLTVAPGVGLPRTGAVGRASARQAGKRANKAAGGGN